MPESKTIQVKPYNEGFWKGYGQVRIKDRDYMRNKLFAALNLSKNSPVQFSQYLRGRIEVKASQAQAIEVVFSEYGITEVWGGKES